jgi:uncharacterized protein YndB with AHSA1/START domain
VLEKVMLKTIGIAVLVLLVGIAGVLAYAATRPDTFRVQRSASIKAPPEKIYPLISDFQSWAAWSPYEKKDPAMKKTFSGPPNGKGAVYEWDGDKNVGKGRITIADVMPPRRVDIKLSMLKPFEAHNDVAFMLEPSGDTTNVTWAMHGRVPYLAKIVHVFLDMDKMVGSDFEAGLASLKAAAER